MPKITSPTFSIGGSSADPTTSESHAPNGHGASSQKVEQKVEDDNREPLEVKNYILLESLLPSPETWEKSCKDNRANRVRFLASIGVIYIVLWVAHAPVAVWKAWSIAHNAELKRLLADRPGLGQPLPASCIVTNCAALCPEASKTRDWYTLYGVPYATLPQQKAYFASATYPYTFKECYLAYWHGVAKDKRAFINGQMRFMGKQAYDDASECAQMKLKKGKNVPVGKPQSCLTLSFHFPWYKESQRSPPGNRGMPIVVYVGGSYLMSHRPRLLSSKLASELRVLYVTVNYRLGVFGFSDFGIEGFGPNHGVADIREALAWIQENARLFGGDKSRVMLYGEDSGATIAAALLASSGMEYMVIEGVRRPLFTHVWMADGSVVIPDIPDSKDAFRELIINDPDLESICKAWTDKYGAILKIDRSHPLGRKFHCLSNLSISKWIEKTPLTWLHSRRADLTLLPHADEIRSSLIKRDPEHTRIENPLGMLHPRSQSWTRTILDIPVVVYSNLNAPYNFSTSVNSSSHWSLSVTEKNVKDALSTFHKPTSQLPYADAIWNAYQKYLSNLIAWRKEDQAPSDLNYRALYDTIRSDLRGTCPYNVYAKHLQLGGHIQRNPIYRILNRIRNQPYVDEDGARCDIPFFLIDNEFECGETTRPLYEALSAEQKEILIRAFIQFAYYGNIFGAQEMQYPVYPGMPALETTYNIITEMGMTTAGSREVSLMSACQIWISEEGEFDHVMKYARMN
ncbi:Carboxylesterase [Paragonimus heterotremus]|uniref:Carboxylesterase n=1 Tax=Paragonimus heterotremus TaxID=100268 RepID=A0A8J4WEC9_9TREM|nr:Carboxylesterase [Paragonimus heterotremus]